MLLSDTEENNIVIQEALELEQTLYDSLQLRHNKRTLPGTSSTEIHYHDLNNWNDPIIDINDETENTFLPHDNTYLYYDHDTNSTDTIIIVYSQKQSIV